MESAMAGLVNPNELISQGEAAELRGVSRASINELIRRGRLRAVEIGGKVLLYRSEVAGFQPSKGGRPPKAEKPATGQKRPTGGASKGKKGGRN